MNTATSTPNVLPEFDCKTITELPPPRTPPDTPSIKTNPGAVSETAPPTDPPPIFSPLSGSNSAHSH